MTDAGESVILLVDPTDRLRRRFEAPLRSDGFETRAVGSASACLDAVEQGDVDGIVSEYALPDIDGMRLIRSIRVTHPTLPFVLAPDDGSESMASEAIASGVSGYFPSDRDPASIVEAVRGDIQEYDEWLNAESGDRYRHLVEASPVPINLFDENAESIWCNRAVLDLLGLASRDELIGKSIFEYIHPDDREVAERELHRVIEEKQSVGPTRMKLRRKDGEIRHILVSTAVGRFLGADIGQAIVVDVTELRETERELDEARRFIESALDSLDDLFYVIDEKSELVRWNEAVPAITGFDRSQLSDSSVTDFFVEGDRDRVRESIRTVRDRGRDTVEATLLTRGGQRIPFEFRFRRLSSGETEDPANIVGVGRDVTDRRERERQLFVLERWLRHNIRNDLNVIQGYSELLSESLPPELSEQALLIKSVAEDLVVQADHQQKVIELVSNPSQPRPLAIDDLVGEQVTELRDGYPTARVSFDPVDEVEALAVPDIRLAVSELVENAIEHNDSEPPEVGIEVVERRGSGVIRITDNGPGIPEIERAELIIDRDVDKLLHGSGLGLFVAYWAVRNSGGDLAFDENEPRGTIIEITLPLPGGD